MYSENTTHLKSILKSILFLIVIVGPVLASSSIANAASYYTVSVSGSTYTTKSPSGGVLYSGSNAASAINKAISSVPAGGAIYIYGGTYPISSQLVGFKNSVTITGDKTAILLATYTSTSYFFLWTGTSSSHTTGLSISNIVFDLNLKTPGIGIKWSNNVRISGIEIRNTIKSKGYNGLELVGTSGSLNTGISVTNSYIHNIYGSGIACAYTTDSTLSGNTFVDCAQYYPSGGAMHPDGGCQRFTITNNNISGRSDNDGIYMGSDRSMASGCVITGNIINLRLYGTGAGKHYAGSGIKIYCINSEVSGNTINWNGTPYVYGISEWGKNNVIKNNIISNAAVGFGDTTTYYSSGTSTISGNKISYCGIGLSLNQSGSTVTSNTLTKCSIPIQNYGRNSLSSNTIN